MNAIHSSSKISAVNAVEIFGQFQTFPPQHIYTKGLSDFFREENRREEDQIRLRIGKAVSAYVLLLLRLDSCTRGVSPDLVLPIQSSCLFRVGLPVVISTGYEQTQSPPSGIPAYRIRPTIYIHDRARASCRRRVPVAITIAQTQPQWRRRSC
jgi:hypothetical protein